MNCIRCGGKLAPPEIMNLPFRSLPGVWLNGLVGQRCGTCGDVEYEIPRIEDLIRALSGQIVLKKARLTGDEVRFMRKSLGWSGVDLASRMGVAPETVSRWESGAQMIGETPDRLLRMFVVYERPVEDYSLEWMATVASEDAAPFTCVLQLEEQRWVRNGTPTTASSVAQALLASSRLESLRDTGR